MLRMLQVQNLAILENIEVSFNEGYTVLTGETGAGKSLILDALHLLLGERASADVIRSNQNVSHIKALFSPVPKAIADLLDLPGLDELLIERSIFKDKPNLIKLNGSMTSLTTLKEIAPFLADIHDQADTRTVLKPAYYPFLIDGMDETLPALRQSYNEALFQYKSSLEALDTFEKEMEQLSKEQEFMTFQLEELGAFNPSLKDEEDLKEALDGLENFDQLFEHLQLIQEGFERPSLTDLHSLQRFFNKISPLQSTYQDLAERYQSALIEIDDIATTVSDMIGQLQFDPKDLEIKQTRLAGYERLKRKHHTDTEGLVRLKESLETSLQKYTDQSMVISSLNQEVENALALLKSHAVNLTHHRQEVANHLIPNVQKTLESLSLPYAQFEIRFDPLNEAWALNSPSPLDFLLSTNPGEPLKPLHKVASGGELSRVMLALKHAFLNKDQVSTLIVDEIDTGVSGKVAAQMGSLLRQISEGVQVIAITHLPQVAAKAHHHLKVFKTVVEGFTQARLEPLDEGSRIEHLAEMLSDGRLTDDQRASAKALLQ
jgi:DNA repair protein RecN (Recombination protein N)